MFMEIVARQRAALFDRQTAIVDALGDRFKEVMAQIAKGPELIFGEPPYIIDDGERALLLVDADGRWSRLPSSFRLSEASVKEGYGALYSLPIPSLGLTVRFIPAKPDFVIDEPDMDAPEAQKFDIEYWAGVDQLFQNYMETLTAALKEDIAKKFDGTGAEMVRECTQLGVTVDEAFRIPTIINILFMYFGDSLLEVAGNGVRADETDEG